MQQISLLDVSSRGESSKKTDKLAIKHFNNFILSLKERNLPECIRALIPCAVSEKNEKEFHLLKMELKKMSHETVETYLNSEKEKVTEPQTRIILGFFSNYLVSLHRNSSHGTPVAGYCANILSSIRQLVYQKGIGESEEKWNKKLNINLKKSIFNTCLDKNWEQDSNDINPFARDVTVMVNAILAKHGSGELPLLDASYLVLCWHLLGRSSEGMKLRYL